MAYLGLSPEMDQQSADVRLRENLIDPPPPRLTPQQIESFVRPAPAQDNTGLLYLLALGALALYA
jgi:hypothetical protein